jgi:hypothetical protein
MTEPARGDRRRRRRALAGTRRPGPGSIRESDRAAESRLVASASRAGQAIQLAPKPTPSPARRAAPSGLGYLTRLPCFHSATVSRVSGAVSLSLPGPSSAADEETTASPGPTGRRRRARRSGRRAGRMSSQPRSTPTGRCRFAIGRAKRAAPTVAERCRRDAGRLRVLARRAGARRHTRSTRPPFTNSSGAFQQGYEPGYADPLGRTWTVALTAAWR